jgi:hypothetical protein
MEREGSDDEEDEERGEEERGEEERRGKTEDKEKKIPP